MNRDKGLPLLVLAVILLLASSLVACAQAPAVPESLPPSPLEPEEPEKQPTYVSSIAWELKAQILQGDLSAFLQKYPIRENRKRGEEVFEGWTHELRFGKGGNYHMVSAIPAANVYQAKTRIENASSLLTEGKLPTEIESRPLDKNEVLMMLGEAKSLLEEQRSSTWDWQEGAMAWAEQPGRMSDIANEATRVDIIETYDDYRERLSKITSKLARILSDLPKAVED